MLLLTIRNVHGALVLSALGGALAVATWCAPPRLLEELAYGLAWLLLLAGPRPVIELALTRDHARAGSDAAQLARLTHLPHLVWIAGWLAATVDGLAWGTASCCRARADTDTDPRGRAARTMGCMEAILDRARSGRFLL